MENAEYLLTAFALVWAGLFGYVLVLVRRQARLKQEIETLKEMLKDRTK